MLESVAVELRIVVEVVGVGKEIVARTEHVAATNVRTWQSHLLRFGYLKAIFGLAVEGFSHLVRRYSHVWCHGRWSALPYSPMTQSCGTYRL